ncbi:MAG: DNA repair protein RadC [Acholeplasmatales bacterium]|jgi:DNA repair protein RadC|nr:DNA repair protein RadC [Acholeplasmatales bacterium]
MRYEKLDTPRKRLIEYGSESLSLKDLVAILFSSGSKSISVYELSEKVVELLEKEEDFINLNYERLIKIKGISTSKACQLVSAIELAKRILNVEKNNLIVSNSEDVFKIYKDTFIGEDREIFYSLYLDIKRRIITSKKLFMGDINSVEIIDSIIFKNYYLANASYIYLIHNHPTGDSKPSLNDIKITNILIKRANILDITIVDHVIIGRNEYYSFIKNDKIYPS